jgi:tyrosyl-tRNA synthetase
MSYTEDLERLETLEARKVLWGVAPTGPIHLGYLPYLLLLRRLQRGGAGIVVLIANYHGYLDASKSSWEDLESRTAQYRDTFTRAGFGSHLMETSQFYGSEKYSAELYRISPVLSLTALRDAGRGTLERAGDDSLANALYVATQILDPYFLQADLVLSGVDESPIYRLGLPMLRAATGFECAGAYLPMCPGLYAAEMHASDAPENKVLLFSDETTLTAQLAGAPDGRARLARYLADFVYPLAGLDGTDLHQAEPRRLARAITSLWDVLTDDTRAVTASTLSG